MADPEIIAVPETSPVPYAHLDVRIDPDDDTIARTSISRFAPQSTAVMNIMIWTRAHTPGDEGYVVNDRECPLAQPVTYRLDVEHVDGSVTTVYSDTTEITGTRGCFLTSTANGACLPVTVVSWDSRARKARSAILAVQNRPDPIALTDVHLWPSGTWVLRTTSREELETLTNVILLPTAPVLLRTQPGSSLRTVYASIGDITETRANPGDGASWVFDLTVAVQEVAPIPATARESNVSWADLVAAYADWTAVRTAFPTWRDVREWPGAAA